MSVCIDEDLYVLSKTFDEIETASIIENDNHKEIITKVGSKLIKEFDNNPTAQKFMDYSLKFAKETNLITKDILNICDKLKSKTLGVSMAMLGNTAFALLNESQKIAILNGNILDESYEIYKLETNGIKISKD